MNKFQVDITDASSLLYHLEKEHGFHFSAPIDVEKIASKLGITIENDPSLNNDDIIGEIRFVNEKPVIRINPIQNTYSARRRFTIAHEIGHYCLHSANTKQGFIDSRKTMSRTDSYWDSYESEANDFAANLLMPLDLIYDEAKSIIDRYLSDTGEEAIPLQFLIDYLADKFKVSTKSMEYRLKNISLI